MIIMLLCFILALTVTESLGCHSTHVPANIVSANVDGEMKLRKKRRAANSFIAMEDFFVDCIEPYLWGSELDVTTVVRFTVRETLWFQITDESLCKNQDTRTCWSQMIIRYLNQNSRLLTIAVACIHRYGQQTGVSAGNMSSSAQTPVGSQIATRQRRQAAGGLPINQVAIESQLRQALPRSIGDVSTIITLAREETICGPGICDCTGIQIPTGETCGQFWYTRIGSLTRLNSSSRSAISNVMNSAILRATIPRTPSPTYSTHLSKPQNLHNRRRDRLNLLIRYIFLWKLLKQTVNTAAPATTSQP